jgi:hypothetical protein
MSRNKPTNGKRAALALQAINAYARPSRFDAYGEHNFFFDFERDIPPGTDQDRLAGLLCGLMHYAERRSLSFPGALAAAQQEHGRQRTAYLPGHAVQRNPRWRGPAPGNAPLMGEVIAARPGRTAQYHVDFITSREWLPEPALAPAPPFPQISTSYGTFSSAFVAAYCLRRVVSGIEQDYRHDRVPDGDRVRDLDTIVSAMSSWGGLPRPALLRSFSHLIAGQDGHLIAGARSGHPVTLAATSMPLPPAAALSGPSAADSTDGVVQPMEPRRPQGRSR